MVSFVKAALLLLSAATHLVSAHTSPAKQHTLSVKEMWNMQKSLWDNFVYPNNVAQMKSINSTFFAPNIQGRVDITRTFDGAELNTEYIFGLFADPAKLSLIGVPLTYNIVRFAAADNIASASTIFMFNSTLFGIQIPINIDTFITFDPATKKITQYDSTFRWLAFLFDELFAALGKRIGATEPAQVTAYLTDSLAKDLCKTHTTYCTGSKQQYADSAACYDFLTKEVRFGETYEMGRNTVLCRSLHSQMLQYRPEVHCPHIGPSGGGMCVDDQTYAQKVLQNYYTNQPFVPRI